MLIHYAKYRTEMQTLIDNHQSFDIVDVPISEMFEVCAVLENYVESQHLKCRVYTQKRLIGGVAGLLRPIYGIGALAGIAAHNILTWNPDYEISRDFANNWVAVEWVGK